MAKYLLALALMLSTMSCRHARVVPPELLFSNAVALREHLALRTTPRRNVTAEMRMTYLGDGKRMRGTASLAIARPNRLRYELIGPHGGVLQAFACDGEQLAIADFPQKRFIKGAATAENIDALIALVPLSLSPSGWVEVLFGELPFPDDAKLQIDDRSGLAKVSWQHQGREFEAELDVFTRRLVMARILQSGHVKTQVHYREWDERGVPIEIELKSSDEAKMRVQLRDVDVDVELDPRVFHLDPPQGVIEETLGRVFDDPSGHCYDQPASYAQHKVHK